MFEPDVFAPVIVIVKAVFTPFILRVNVYEVPVAPAAALRLIYRFERIQLNGIIVYVSDSTADALSANEAQYTPKYVVFALFISLTYPPIMDTELLEAPVGPVSPFMPVGPVGPVRPVAPVLVVEPAGPVTPVGPCVPV